MELWERQLIRGQYRQWAFPIEHIEELAAKGELLLFKGGDLALHFIQKRDGYWECHPPMYDKANNHRYLAKYMWFNLIRYAHESNLGFLNLGGGIDSWREMIAKRDEFPNPKYKWIYVPQAIKDNLLLAPDYYIENYALRIRETN